jgi:hypothetical protein
VYRWSRLQSSREFFCAGHDKTVLVTRNTLAQLIFFAFVPQVPQEHQREAFSEAS